MGRVFILVGFLLMMGGFLIPFLSRTGVGALPGLTSIPGLTEPKATDLCNAGEKLERSSGSSARIPGTNTYSHSVSYICIDDKGIRRDVTDRFALGLGKEAGSFINQVFGSIASSIAISMLGAVLLVIGILKSIRNGIAAGKLRVYTPVYADVTGNFTQSTRATAAPEQDAASKLRQLDSMLREKLITQAEYDTKRKEIVNKF